MKLGVFIKMKEDMNIDTKFRELKEMGFDTCQLNSWNLSLCTRENADEILKASEKYGITITAFWCGWSGPKVWDFYSGPHTAGLVPEEHRAYRVNELKIGSDFAKMLGVKDVVTHVGFLPEVPTTTEYHKLICTLKQVAEYMKSNDQYFLFETGQETPITLKRTIVEVGTGNLGINLDPANLILYGKANPCDAVDIFGDYVRGVHAKDGEYPTDPAYLGEEKRIGDGRANFPVLIKKLIEHGYDGSLTIEREIDGAKQVEDILYAKKFLEDILNG